MIVGFLLFDGLEELDLVGPWEVWSMAAESRSEVRCVAISEDGKGVRCAKGLRVLADHGFSDAPDLDVLVVPGGRGTRREVDNPALLAWIEGAARSCAWVTSVCTGSLLLTAAQIHYVMSTTFV